MKVDKMFPKFSDKARIWIYAFSYPLSDLEMRVVEKRLQSFIAEWHAHGQPVNGDFIIKDHKFIILCGEPADKISGCSIDSSVRVLKKLQEDGLDALNHHLIHYRSGQEIVSVERPIFQKLILSGKITKDTLVFNTTLQTLKEIRQGKWEIKLNDSWHAEAFKMSA